MLLQRISRILLAFALLAVAACGGGDGGEEDDTLTVYSGRSESLIEPLIQQFTEATGIQVEVRYGDSADLALLIDTEGDRSPADVFISQSPGAIGFLADNDRLTAIDDVVLGLVSNDFRNGDGLWVGLSGRVRALVYNTDLVDPAVLPSSVFNVTDASFSGNVGLAPANGSFQDFVTAMREIDGDDATLAWLSGMRANGSQPYASNSAIVEAVGRGEVPFGLVNHYYALRALAEDPTLPIANHFFGGGDIGSLVIVTAAGVIEGTDNPSSAATFLEWMLGETAQTFYSTETLEYPLAADVAAADVLPPLIDLQTATYDFDSLGGGLERTKELIDESGLEAPSG